MNEIYIQTGENRSGSPMSVYAELGEINIWKSNHWKREGIEDDVPMLLEHEILHIVIQGTVGKEEPNACSNLDNITVEHGITLQGELQPTEKRMHLSKGEIALMHFNKVDEDVFFKTPKTTAPIPLKPCGKGLVRVKGKCITIEEYTTGKKPLTGFEKYYKSGIPLKTVKTVSAKPETRAVQKKVKKPTPSVHVLEQRKKTQAMEKERRLKIFEGWGVEKCNLMLLRFEDLVRAGQSHRNIAAALGYKHPDDLKYFIEDQYSDKRRRMSLKQIYLSIKSKMDAPTEEWRKFPKGRHDFSTRVALGFCPIVSSDERSVESRKYPPIVKGGVFCKNLDIVPDISVQPIKRLRKAVHSFNTADWWKKEQEELDNLLVDVSDTIKQARIKLNYRHTNKAKLLKELSIAFVDTEEDKFLTHEGGIIISMRLSKLEELHAGDKLLGLHGLKGIVCEVRDIPTDLLINRNQVWGLKSSSMMGGAVLELQKTNTLKCFYQSTHKVQASIFKEETGRIIGSAKISPPARFSPDLVPFLMYYLGHNVLYELTKYNREKLKDVLYMLNLTIENVNEFIQFEALKILPQARRGGKLEKFGKNEEGFFFSKKEYQPHLSKTKVIYGDKSYYPFLLKRLWIPDWLDEEGYLKYFDKKREIWCKTDLACLLTQDYEEKWTFKSTQPAVHLLYKQIYGDIENSIGYLIAIPKNDEPEVITLCASECIERNIIEGEKVLVWRPPVVSARLPKSKYSAETKHSNILKLRVKYGTEPKTACINTATMRLMFGDFDGDALYIMKIPKDAANDLIPGTELDEEIKAVKEDIKDIDGIVFPTTKKKIVLAMNRAFVKEQDLEGAGHTTISLKNGRSTEDILYEAGIKHTEAAKESGKITKIGGLTKWGWMACNTTEIASLIQAIQSLEVMKDRPGKDTVEYDKNERYLGKLKEKILPKVNKKLSKAQNTLLTRYNYGYELFIRFLSKSSYETGLTPYDRAPSYGALLSKRLCPSKSMIGKWVLLLSR